MFLPGPATTPDDHSEDEENSPRAASTHRTAEVGHIEERADNTRGHDLREPVQEGIQGSRAGVEVGDINCVSLVGVEPVGRPEHWEKQDDKRFVLQRVVEPVQLGFPCWVFHYNDAGSVATNDLLRVTEHKSQTSAKEHQDNESNVRSVRDSGSDFDVDIRAESDLRTVD
jgi:hypothetical protein